MRARDKDRNKRQEAVDTVGKKGRDRCMEFVVRPRQHKQVNAYEKIVYKTRYLDAGRRSWFDSQRCIYAYKKQRDHCRNQDIERDTGEVGVEEGKG